MSDQYPTQQPYGQQPAATAGGEPPLWAPYHGISFGKAFTRFFKKYATFSGRASRSEYWWWYLWSVIIGTVGSIITGILTAATGTTTTTTSSTSVGFSTMSTNPLAGTALWIIGLALIIPTLALIVRRLHDANLSGLLALLLLIPFFGAIAVFIMMFLPSNPAGERFDRPDGRG
ncbi:DUF805 domain-containing protein [Curtobacterium sp. SP.BCo]|uniref:DUF805 domain-containing protein n=1 Tax=Curtobacterium sp. SP.BCo TaxID=3435229 RepID=UPI003F73EB9A